MPCLLIIIYHLIPVPIFNRQVLGRQLETRLLIANFHAVSVEVVRVQSVGLELLAISKHVGLLLVLSFRKSRLLIHCARRVKDHLLLGVEVLYEVHGLPLLGLLLAGIVAPLVLVIAVFHLTITAARLLLDHGKAGILRKGLGTLWHRGVTAVLTWQHTHVPLSKVDRAGTFLIGWLRQFDTGLLFLLFLSSLFPAVRRLYFFF